MSETEQDSTLGDPVQPAEPEPAQTPPGSPESDTEPGGTEEPVEEPDEPQEAAPIATEARTAQQIEAAQASWDRERDRHMRELQKRDDVRYGESAICPLCDGHGLFWPVIPEPEQTLRRQFIHQALGADVPKEYRKHPTEARCEVCDGLGQLESGSQVEGQILLNCTACNATGHKPFGAPAGAAVTFTQTGSPTGGPDEGLPWSTVPIAEQMRIGNDAWGRPPGDLHYGVPRVQLNSPPVAVGA